MRWNPTPDPDTPAEDVPDWQEHEEAPPLFPMILRLKMEGPSNSALDPPAEVVSQVEGWGPPAPGGQLGGWTGQHNRLQSGGRRQNQHVCERLPVQRPT